MILELVQSDRKFAVLVLKSFPSTLHISLAAFSDGITLFYDGLASENANFSRIASDIIYLVTAPVMVTSLTRSVVAEKDGYPASCERVLALLLIRDQISFRQQRNMKL